MPFRLNNTLKIAEFFEPLNCWFWIARELYRIMCLHILSYILFCSFKDEAFFVCLAHTSVLVLVIPKITQRDIRRSLSHNITHLANTFTHCAHRKQKQVPHFLSKPQIFRSSFSISMDMSFKVINHKYNNFMTLVVNTIK